MRGGVVRALAAFFCAVALHAALALFCGWLSPASVELPTLDLTSVDLSFSDAPDKTASPAASAPPVPPQPESAVSPPPPAAPPPMELPPDRSSAMPLPSPPRRDSLSPELPEPPPETKIANPNPQPETRNQEPETRNQEPEPRNQEQLDAPAPSQARVDAVKPPSPMRRIKPDYPRGARERREEGDVTLELGISAEGTVDSVKIVSSCGFAELEAAAVAAARKARFNPARQGGKAIPHSARMTLQFRLK